MFYATKDKRFGFIKSILTDESKVRDCMQQCYLQLWERIDRIDTDQDVLPLLFTYSRNIAIDTLRKNAKYVWVDDVSI
ncbi:sigma factor, partial [Acinetobacter baumannii]